MIGLERELLRDTGLRWRGRDLVVKVTREGLYLKGSREHWRRALFLSWAQAFDTAAAVYAAKRREERASLRRKGTQRR